MSSVAKNTGGALAMGFAWFLAGAMFGLFVMEMIDPNGEIADVWPAVLGYPGFVGGVAFSVFLQVFERGRSYAEIPLSRAAIWGAASGAAVPAAWLALVFASNPTAAERVNFNLSWPPIAAMTGLAILVMSLAGVATVAYLRVASANLRTMRESSTGR
jgi:hypothetical protein